MGEGSGSGGQVIRDRASQWVGAGLSVGALAATPGSSAAQDPPAERTASPATGLWQGAYTRYRVADQFWYHGEYHVRTREQFVTEMAQLYLRFGVTWRPLENVELTGGLVTPLYWASGEPSPDRDRVVPQLRLWEQAILTQTLGRAKLYHQYRLEQRWRRDYDVGAAFQLSFRWRYKISAYVPLNKARMVAGTLFLNLNEEVFIQSGPSIIYDHFEDNRVYGGLGYVLSDSVQFQAGYMWTFRHDGAPNVYQNRHILRLSVYHNFDLRTLRRPE